MNNNRNITIVVPYIQDTGEKFKKVCQAKGIQVHFKGTNTLKTLLVTPKAKDHKLNKSGVIYHVKCPHISCPDEYIGESGRTLGKGLSNILKLHLPFTNIAVQQATHSVQSASTSYTGKNKVHQETSRKQCSSM